MPRVKPTKSEEEQLLFEGTIEKYRTMRKTNYSKMAMAISMSESALYRKVKDMWTFRLSELRRLYNYLGVPEEERIKI